MGEERGTGTAASVAVHMDLSAVGEREARGLVAAERDGSLEGVGTAALLRELVARADGVTASLRGDRRTLTATVAL